jgi:hypothetical protein
MLHELVRVVKFINVHTYAEPVASVLVMVVILVYSRRAHRRMRIQEQCGVLDFFSHRVPTYTADERYNYFYPSNMVICYIIVDLIVRGCLQLINHSIKYYLLVYCLHIWLPLHA